MFRLAHVTDPHFRAFGLAGLSLRGLLGKRLLGAANIVVNRWRKHRMDLLESLGQHLAAQRPDHVALTGDVGNVAWVSEWQAGRRWLERYAGPPADVTVIPGNHDAYVNDVTRTGAFESLFAAYQHAERGGGGAAGTDSREAYPFVRVRGPLALVAVNTCVPTGDFGAWGEIGPAQLRRLEAILGDDDVRRRVRVVLMHHPPVVHRKGEDRNLRDRGALAEVLARVGADLVLHGHDHRDEAAVLEGPRGSRIMAVGAGSASYAGPAEGRARYNVYGFREDGRGIELHTYAHDARERSFVEVSRKTLAP
ncbi:MAG: metallophosphoesterase [Myxococcales bacterium]|nr:metallophosphoesterase [Myxococcales bacterium]